MSTPAIVVTEHAIGRALLRVVGEVGLAKDNAAEWLRAAVEREWPARRNVEESGAGLRALVPIPGQLVAVLRDSLESGTAQTVLTVITQGMRDSSLATGRYRKPGPGSPESAQSHERVKLVVSVMFEDGKERRTIVRAHRRESAEKRLLGMYGAKPETLRVFRLEDAPQ
ncbi:MAG: hypothetical protein WC876_01735 [Candidatus Thermoplasmatota archaeon]